jgi:hypothetical protein
MKYTSLHLKWVIQSLENRLEDIITQTNWLCFIYLSLLLDVLNDEKPPFTHLSTCLHLKRVLQLWYQDIRL